MLQVDWLILVGVGGVFILLGLAALIWGKREEKGYYNSLTGRLDLSEYVSHQPERAEPGAQKVGGWIAIAIGLIMVVVGAALWLWG